MMSKENGHEFDFETEVCKKCGLSKSKYDDSSFPSCRGVNRQLKFGDDSNKKSPNKS